nr:unnamed protein product [Digitaria exilis]
MVRYCCVEALPAGSPPAKLLATQRGAIPSPRRPGCFIHPAPLDNNALLVARRHSPWAASEASQECEDSDLGTNQRRINVRDKDNAHMASMLSINCPWFKIQGRLTPLRHHVVAKVHLEISSCNTARRRRTGNLA